MTARDTMKKLLSDDEFKSWDEQKNEDDYMLNWSEQHHPWAILTYSFFSWETKEGKDYWDKVRSRFYPKNKGFYVSDWQEVA